MCRFSQISEFARLQQTLDSAIRVVPNSGDVIAMVEVVEHLAALRITMSTMEELQTLAGDALSAAYEYGQSIGAQAKNQDRSFAAMGRFIFQPEAVRDVLSAELREITCDIAVAITACSAHLPGRVQRARRRRAWRRTGRKGRRNARP